MHAPALTLKDFCDAYRVCRETAYQQIRARRLRAVKLGRKTLILRVDAEVWAASLPELRHRQCPPQTRTPPVATAELGRHV